MLLREAACSGTCVLTFLSWINVATCVVPPRLVPLTTFFFVSLPSQYRHVAMPPVFLYLNSRFKNIFIPLLLRPCIFVSFWNGLFEAMLKTFPAGWCRSHCVPNLSLPAFSCPSWHAFRPVVSRVNLHEQFRSKCSCSLECKRVCVTVQSLFHYQNTVSSSKTDGTCTPMPIWGHVAGSLLSLVFTVIIRTMQTSEVTWCSSSTGMQCCSHRSSIFESSDAQSIFANTTEHKIQFP